MDKKVAAGNRLNIRAQTWNDVLDMLQAYKRGDRVNPSSRGSFGAVIKNNSGGAVGRFGILEISGRGVGADDFVNIKTLTGIQPASADPRSVAVVQMPLADGQFGRAIFAGETIARVDVQDTSDKFAKVSSGSHILSSSASDGQFHIVEPPSGTGEQDLLVAFVFGTSSVPGAESRIVKTPPAGIPALSGTTITTASCEAYDAVGTTLTASGDNIDVYSVDDAIPGDTYVIATYVLDGTYCASARSSSLPLRYGLAISPLSPGGSTTVQEVEWTGTTWSSLGDPPVTVYDTLEENCYLTGEVVPFFQSDVTSRAEVLGSFGLTRWARCAEHMVPDIAGSTALMNWAKNYTFDVASWDPTGVYSPQISSAAGAFTFMNPGYTVQVRDPLRMSVVWAGQIVQIRWCREMGAWVLHETVGSVQRGRITATDDFRHSGPSNPGDIGVSLYSSLPLSGQSQGDWSVQGNFTVRVKREYARCRIREGDEVEIRREPIARGQTTNNPYEHHSAWVISELSERVILCQLTEAQGSTPANRKYDLRHADGALFVAGWTPRPLLDTYARVSGVNYNPGKLATVQVRYSNTGYQPSDYVVVACNETPYTEGC